MVNIKKIIKHFREYVLSQDDWFKKVAKSHSSTVFHNGVQLPSFPPDQIQVNTTGKSGAATLREAFVFYLDCVEVFNSVRPIKEDDLLLDFGVGWGRIARFFLRDLPIENIHGLDVMEEFVTICQQTFKSDNFYVTTPFPPTEIPDSKFNYIVGYSVFSHLSEAACSSWMSEFSRILAPGGMVALTTRGRPFFDYCESLNKRKKSEYQVALSKMFDNFPEARMRYDQGEFVHSNREGVDGGGAMTAEFYGETFIPEKYAETAYSDHFVLEKFLYDPSRQTHPIMFFRKK